MAEDSSPSTTSGEIVPPGGDFGRSTTRWSDKAEQSVEAKAE